MIPAYWPQATHELSAADPIMAEIISRYPGEAIQSRGDAFHTLMRSITGQQISVKAADAIWARMEAQLSEPLSPQTMMAVEEDALRACGYSRQKIGYIQSLCAFFCAREHLERDWSQMNDEEVITDITQIKGIGRWTAEMFLMFHLLRPNVLPLDDIGLINAAAKFYHQNEKRGKKAVRELAEQWHPWRSVATWYLWRTYDDEAVAY